MKTLSVFPCSRTSFDSKQGLNESTRRFFLLLHLMNLDNWLSLILVWITEITCLQPLASSIFFEISSLSCNTVDVLIFQLLPISLDVFTLLPADALILVLRKGCRSHLSLMDLVKSLLPTIRIPGLVSRFDIGLLCHRLTRVYTNKFHSFIQGTFWQSIELLTCSNAMASK